MTETNIGTRTSYSKLSTWMRCPRKYRLRYIDDAPEETTPVSLIFGTAIHEACEVFLAALKDGQPAVNDEVYGAFHRAFDDSVKLATDMNVPVDWGNNTHKDMIAKGEGLIATFLAEVDRGIRVIATEAEFEFEISPGRVVNGVIDVILDDGHGRYRVVDIKTAATTYGPDRLEHDMQPTVYIAAAEHMYGAPGRVNFEYWCLIKTKKPQFKVLPVVRDARDRAELVEAIDDIDAARMAGVFPRIRGFMCAGCEYAGSCATCKGVRS
jgi:CRISPR/Cas system-associated exonuclease Cas4 (RecB family)